MALAMALLLVPLFADIALALVGNLFARRRRGAAVRPIRLAVVLPAHDEQIQIAHTVQSLLEAGCVAARVAQTDDEDDEFLTKIFVVAHNCSDETAAQATAAGAVVMELNDRAARGKGAALRAGFAAASAAGANAFLVVDADSIASCNLIAAMRAALAAGEDVVQCRYELELPAEAPAFSRDRLRALAFRGINVLRARGRAAWGFSAGLFGNGFALSEEALKCVPYDADSICEDMEYHGRLVARGLRVAWVEDAYVLAEISRPGETQARQEARWEGGRLRVALDLAGPLLMAVLGGRWRAFGTFLEFFGLPTSRAVIGLMIAACVPVPWLQHFAGGCAVLLLLYVIGASWLGNEPGCDLAALCLAPAHILWKIVITPAVLVSSQRRAEWVRTGRGAERG